MRKHLFKRIISWMVVLAMALGMIPAAHASEKITWQETDLKITAELPDRRVETTGSSNAYADSDRVRVSIVLEEPSTVDAGYATMDIAGNGAAMTYSQRLHAQQKQMEKTISARALNGQALDVVWNMTLVGNIISAWVPYGSIEAIAAVPGVREVALEAKYEPCEARRVENLEPAAYTSSGMIGSGALWEQGLTGAGTRIAIVDTGTDTDHQSFDNGAYLYALSENAKAKGMSLEAYQASLDLLTAQDIAAVLPEMNLYELDPDVDVEDLYINEKLAFGYNYVDGNLNIVHDNDYQGEHGSHVAGISTANRYIPGGSGYQKAADAVKVLGVAPDAQLITMKVFGDNSPYDSDYMAAIEDAILLGCDAVNLSMGTTAPGSPVNSIYAELLEKMTRTDTVVVMSAGNAGSWAQQSLFGYLYHDDVSFDTVGAPGSYGSAFTVASVDNGDGGAEYYTMSYFSSWGVPGDLSLKPEITAPGGSIYSVWGSNALTGGGSDRYETMSGTSMAAPQVTGMTALLSQYFRESGIAAANGISARHLAQSLLMSTATPLLEEENDGGYYSLLNQGAGLARVDLAAAADSYVLVDGQADGKVKAELGDDPDRTGVYEFTFTISNMTKKAQTYALEADTFRQNVFEYTEGSDVWLLDTWTTALAADVTFRSGGQNLGGSSGFKCDLNGDGVTDQKDADHLLEYLMGNETALKANGDVSGDGKVNSYDAHVLLKKLSEQSNVSAVTVGAGKTVSITATIALTDGAKAEMDTETPKGTYVEAFVYARQITDDGTGTVHSIPMLAFYGDWSEPAMYDRGTFVEYAYRVTDAAPYLYRYIGPYGNALSIDYGDGREYYYGGNPVLDDDTYLPKRNAMSSSGSSRLVEQGFTLIRGAGAGRLTVCNADTGAVYFQRELGELSPTYFHAGTGSWENTIQYARLNWCGTDASGSPLADGTRVEVSLTTVPHYYQKADGSYSFDGLGSGATMTTSLTIDNTAPKALSIDTDSQDDGILTVTAQDNQYVAAVALLNATGTKFMCVETPNQTQKNAKVTMDLDLNGVYGKKFLVAVYDYAMNVTAYEVELDLPMLDRPYFTGIDCNSGMYVGLDMNGTSKELAETGLGAGIRAAEYVDGYVFVANQDNQLWVSDDTDLYNTRFVGELDEDGVLDLVWILDMAYNVSDGKLYALFYSYLNDRKTPYLGTIDMDTGSLNMLFEMPVDVHALAIDDAGNCYSAGYGSAELYKYTIAGAAAGNVTCVGQMGSYETIYSCSMAWDHSADKLYFAVSNTLLCIDPDTANPTILGYHNYQIVGLYVRDPQPGGRFDPTDKVASVELDPSSARVLKGSKLSLSAQVYPWYVSDDSVTWTSSNSSVAKVDANGTVTGVGVGKCTITAASSLDPSVRASCSVEVLQINKTLNALVWDEESEIWMSRFNTGTLPGYTKLSSGDLGQELASATVGEDGTIYAASLDLESLRSSLYKLDPKTYQPTLIGPSTDGYVDLAPAPSLPGNSLVAAFGGNVLLVDADTGDFYEAFNLFAYNLVGLAYAGSQKYQAYGFDAMVDWYFIIDRAGTVFLMGFLEQNGSYYYLDSSSLTSDGIYTQIDFEMETPYFGSAYFDGEFLYYSAYSQSQNNVTLMAIDVAGGSRACYELGTFDDNVWPVAGLMELGTMGGGDGIFSQQFVPQCQPVRMESAAELTGIERPNAEGILNAAVETNSGADVKADQVTVNVTLPADAPNGTVQIRYDAKMMKLTGVSGRTAAFAWSGESGVVDLAFAEAASLTSGTTTARLTFQPLRSGKTTLSVITQELGNGTRNSEETLNLTLIHDCPSAKFEDVPQEKWFHEPVDYVLEQGYMVGIDATHFGPDRNMTRAQFVTVLYRMVGEPPVTSDGRFTDVEPNRYYTNAVAWAVANGITAGKSATTFAPNGKLTRSELVTFLYRYANLKGYDTTATADENTFNDSNLIPNYSRTAWSWALTHGMISGVGGNRLAPTNLTTRAQAAALFQRMDNAFA